MLCPQPGFPSRDRPQPGSDLTNAAERDDATKKYSSMQVENTFRSAHDIAMNEQSGYATLCLSYFGY